MSLQLAREEPEAGPWRAESLAGVVGALIGRGSGRPGVSGRPVVAGRPVVVAVDGRSNAGKTTLAARICSAVPGSAVVHTDDIAWEHSRFGWSDLLADGILAPVRQGRGVSFRPPRWAEHGREGSIDVPSGCPLLVIEGDGAGRREVGDLIDVLIWVQSDEREVTRRAWARAAHADAIDGANLPADQRTWERADLIVCGTPEIPFEPVTEVVVAEPRSRAVGKRKPSRISG